MDTDGIDDNAGYGTGCSRYGLPGGDGVGGDEGRAGGITGGGSDGNGWGNGWEGEYRGGGNTEDCAPTVYHFETIRSDPVQNDLRQLITNTIAFAHIWRL